MSYPQEISVDTLRDLIARRELYGFRAGPHRMRQVLPFTPPGGHLRMNSYQKFIENMFSPNTEYRAIHLMWSAGVGKTIGALAPAMNFVRIYRQTFATAVASRGTTKISRSTVATADASTPSVFVLGFDNTETAFVRDLLNYTHFGVVTEAEQAELQNLRRQAASGNDTDAKRYSEYYFMLKRRITDKMKGGFFKFLGYNKFVNRLFYSNGITLEAIEAEARERWRKDSDTTLESVMQEYIDKGEVVVNEDLISMLHNSLLICDEIHETYNTMTRNNRGVAIQYVLDRVPSLRIITMSATPINNSPTEAVSFANYFVKDKIRKSDVFASETEFRPGGKERLGRALFGKISFVQDTDRRFFPTREMCGEELAVPRDIFGFRAGESLPYLKFIRCEMSELHRKVMMAYFEGNYEEKSVPTDGNTLFDMAFPSPRVIADDGSINDSMTVDDAASSFRTSRFYDAIGSADTEWKQAIGIDVHQRQLVKAITGRFLAAENLSKYSAKYARLLEETIDAFRKRGPQKLLIYHNRVEMSGVVLIQEMLKENGILDEVSAPVPTTLCVQCGRPMSEHPQSGDDGYKHQFIPIRSVVVHSNNPDATNRTALAKFDDPSNSTGLNCAILIGSKLIRQGYDFKALRAVLVTSVPSSIYGLIQILGRGIRNNSHALLEPENRHVLIKLFLSTWKNDITPEVLRYIRKLRYHLVSQEIIQEWETNSVDANINYDINMSSDMMKMYFPNGTSLPPQKVIENLYYQPRVQIPNLRPVDLSSVTYYAHGHYLGTVRTIVMLIKYAFTRRPAWTREELHNWVKAADVAQQYDPALFEDGQIDIAISYLLRQQKTTISKSVANASSSIYNFTSKFVQIGAIRHSIVAAGDYYILVPATTTSAGGKVITGEPILDVETYARTPEPRQGISFNLAVIDVHTKTIIAKTKEKLSRCQNKYAFLTAIPTEYQIGIVREIISGARDIGVPKERIASIMDILRSLGALVTAKQVRTYTAVSVIVGEMKHDDSHVVGYADGQVLHIYNNNKWFVVKKDAMNRKIDFRENNKIVGMLETAGGVTKLKLRRNIELIRGSLKRRSRGVTDTRLVERGMVCETQPRARLLSIMKSLGITGGERTKEQCSLVLSTLIELEIKERREKTKTKYLYGWWDTPVNIAAAVAP